jgi:glycosyltransferase involved in cell wall biosynthesis
MDILVTSIVDLNKSAHNSRLHQFLKVLSDKHEILVLSINDWWKAKWDDQSEEYNKDFENSLSNIKQIYLTEKKISPILQEIYSISTVGQVFKKIEGFNFNVHFNYNSLISGFVVANKMNSMGVNTIYDIADDLPGMIKTSPQINKFLRPIGGFIGDLTVKKNIKMSTKVTCTTNLLRDSSGIPLDKVEIIPNGVDIELFKKYQSEEIKIKLGINDNFIVGYVGVLREWINLKPLFIAMKKLNKFNIKMLIVGGGVGYEENVRLARDCGVLKNIIFIGTIPYTQIPKYISCMDVCVIPFKIDTVAQNSLPLKLFEYMACEKPVISTKVNGIIENVGNRIMYASNSTEYYNKIIELYKNEEMRNIMGRNGRKFVFENYNWSNICTNLEKILIEAGD